jgi:hypothetical protein
MEALEWLSANEPAEFARLLPGGKVPCIVHVGLTEDEEILIRVDHGTDEDRVPLDEYSEFLAIKQLLKAWPGESQARIAEKLGIVSTKGKNKGQPNRSYVQDRVSLARLPLFVQDEYRKLWEVGKDSTPVRIAQIKTLYTAYNAEFATYPDGDGPEFSAKWSEVMNPVDNTVSADDSATPKDLKASEAKTRAMGCNSKTLRRVLLALTNQGGDVVALDASIASLETDSQILSDIRLLVGADEFAKIVSEARDNRLAIDAAKLETAEA